MKKLIFLFFASLLMCLSVSAKSRVSSETRQIKSSDSIQNDETDLLITVSYAKFRSDQKFVLDKNFWHPQNFNTLFPGSKVNQSDVSKHYLAAIPIKMNFFMRIISSAISIPSKLIFNIEPERNASEYQVQVEKYSQLIRRMNQDEQAEIELITIQENYEFNVLFKSATVYYLAFKNTNSEIVLFQISESRVMKSFMNKIQKLGKNPLEFLNHKFQSEFEDLIEQIDKKSTGLM